jgi:hypothetical protein
MATIAEVEKLALDLPETEGAILAAHLLGSLSSMTKMKVLEKLCVATQSLDFALINSSRRSANSRQEVVSLCGKNCFFESYAGCAA